MTHVEVFDPPMCCSSGVCGPSVDPLLAAFAADVEWLTAKGVAVSRHNLSQNPQPFVSNRRVLDLMQREGTACLPIVLVNDEELGHGAYPRREELARAAGLVASASQNKTRIRLSVEGCCRPGSECC
jgi:arsenical resistance operon trans-acting repressor ArsD